MRPVIQTALAALLGVVLAADPLTAAEISTNATPYSTTNAPAVVQPETHVLQVGDRLNYRVVEDREDPRFLPVTASGEIEVPYLGKVLVAGKTVAAAAKELKGLLEKDLYYKATVVLSVEELAPRPFEMSQITRGGHAKQIFVVGQVRAQGAQDLPYEEKYTLSRAIIKAGGFSSFANGRKVQIVRKTPEGKAERIVADVLSVLKDGKVENDVELQPDDMVIVPEKLVNF